MRAPLLIALLIALLAAIAPFTHAQRMVPACPRFAPGNNRGAHASSFFYPLTFSDPIYSDYLSSTGYPVASQPSVIVFETSPAATPVPERTPAEPLTIELQGDRYVRVSGEQTSETGSETGSETESETKMIDPRPDPPRRQQQSAGGATHAVAARELASTVLVFRDGHREEVSDYTIADGVLYTRSDFYTPGFYSPGSWNRKIDLSSLDLSETLQSNQSRGVRFQLPQAPNEVIVGP
jgi:hypothetical protein